MIKLIVWETLHSIKNIWPPLRTLSVMVIDTHIHLDYAIIEFISCKKKKPLRQVIMSGRLLKMGMLSPYLICRKPDTASA